MRNISGALFLLILDNAAYYAQGVVDGLAQALDNLEIQYTYHIHEGSEGTTSNGCYTKPITHSHNNACYCSGYFTHNGTNVKNCSFDNNTIYPIVCSNCGRYEQWYGKDMSRYGAYNVCGRFICTKSTSEILKYSLGCGKTEGTIESATIIY